MSFKKMANDDDKKLDLIVKSNKLIEASYKLTQAEFNLLSLVFTQLNTGKIGSSGNWLLSDYKVTAQAYSEMYNVDINTAYEALQTASKNLFRRYFSYEREVDFSPYAVEIVESRWVSEVRYNRQSGYVTVVLTPTVMDMVGMLQNRYTPYILQHTTSFTSIHAKRLYEIIVQWRNTNKQTPKIDVGTLRDRLGIDAEQYPLIADLKKRVLDVAIEQINKHSDIKVKYDQIKEGRKIVAFFFKFRDKKPKQVDQPIRDPNTIDFIEGLTDAELKTIAEQADKHIAKNNITDIKHRANIHSKAQTERWGITDHSQLAPSTQVVDMPELDTTQTNIKAIMQQSLTSSKG